MLEQICSLKWLSSSNTNSSTLLLSLHTNFQSLTCSVLIPPSSASESDTTLLFPRLTPVSYLFIAAQHFTPLAIPLPPFFSKFYFCLTWKREDWKVYIQNCYEGSFAIRLFFLFQGPKSCTPCSVSQSPNHWTTKKVPSYHLLYYSCQFLYSVGSNFTFEIVSF